MTQKIILGCDPGQTGAIALLADGDFAGFADMPVTERKAGGFIIAPALLADAVRSLLALRAGADRLAVVESVHAMPDQGVSGAFRFGQSDGILRGILGALALPQIEVSPVRWKRELGLVGKPKDCARTLAIQMYPSAAAQLTRKKDVGRADALMIAHWAYVTGAGP